MNGLREFKSLQWNRLYYYDIYSNISTWNKIQNSYAPEPLEVNSNGRIYKKVRSKTYNQDYWNSGNINQWKYPIETKINSVILLKSPDGVLDPDIWKNYAIAQQENCTGAKGGGLSGVLCKKYPYGCAWKNRKPDPKRRGFTIPADYAKPGTIQVKGAIVDNEISAFGPLIINMFAQFNPAGPNNREDTKLKREKWFKECLDKISSLKLYGIAFPEYIGCNIAQGDWGVYMKMITDFARDNPSTKVAIVRRTTA
tara:strand:+ start:171 stop:932 length:762 start_codon:yes stop_codon:yes gene_type:complete